MKRILIVVAFAALAYATVCAQEVDLGVIPQPQSVELLKGKCTIKARPEVVYNQFNNESNSSKSKRRNRKESGNNVSIPCYIYKVDSIANAKNQNQAYGLLFTNNKVRIFACDIAGVRNAQLTLDQIFTLNEGNVPYFKMIDWPEFEFRGFLDDMSRGPISTDEFRVAQMAEALSLKYNFGSYYTEHVLYNDEFRDIAPRDGLHLNDETFARFSQNLMANIQCFAHAEKTLANPFYDALIDTRTNFNPAVEASYTLIKSQIAATMRAYPDAQFININCDETEGLGSGRAHDYVEKIGVEKAYTEHIKRICDIARPYGKTILMWGDIVAKNSAMIADLPNDVEYIMWSYVSRDNFNDMLQPFVENREHGGANFWVAPGVSHWTTIFPSHVDFLRNIAYLARDGAAAGARGLINTAWDDVGESLYSDASYPMLWAAEMAWKPIKSVDPAEAERELDARRKEFDARFNRRYNSPNLAELLLAVGDLKVDANVRDWYNSATLYEPLLDFYPDKVNAIEAQRTVVVTATIDSLISAYDLPRLGEPLNDSAAALPSYAHAVYALHRLQFMAQKSQLRIALYNALTKQNTDIAQLGKQIDAYLSSLHSLLLEYLALWDAECTEYHRAEIKEKYFTLAREAQEALMHVFIDFDNSTSTPAVRLRTIDPNSEIHYTLDGSNPTRDANTYSAPFTINVPLTVRAIAYSAKKQSNIAERHLLAHTGFGRPIALATQYSTYRDLYSGGGSNALIDGITGSDFTYADGHWQGYQGVDINVTIDLEKVTDIHSISMRFMQNTIDWILSAEKIEIYTSNNGTDWTLARSASYAPDYRELGNVLRICKLADLNLQTRFLKIVVPNPGLLPDWSPGGGYPSYLFTDEIVIQ